MRRAETLRGMTDKQRGVWGEGPEMKKNLFFILFTLCIFMLFLRSVHAQEGMTAALTSEQQDLTVGDVVDLLLEVSHPAGEHVIFPQLGQTWGDFEVREQSPPAVMTHEDGSQSSQQTIAVTLWAPGSFTTPLLTVTVSTPSGALSEVRVEPVTLRVLSVLEEGDTDLRALKPQATLWYLPLWVWQLAGLLLAIFILFVILLLIYRIVSKPRATLPDMPDIRPAYQIALDDLASIREQQLPAQGDFKRHYSLVSGVLRRYLVQGYGISAMDQTTSQIKEGLEGISESSIAPEHKKELMSILAEADFVKFANVEPEIEAAEQLTERVRVLILATRPSEMEPSAHLVSSVGKGKQAKAAEVTP